jgi:hypothetical protein
MVGGFIITGNESKPVVLRGIGPSLALSGISDLLLDPVLELRGTDGNLIMRNDNWKDDQRSLIEGHPFQPTDDRESVIMATLQPGAYTVILTGKNQTTGCGLVEIYDNNPVADSELANISTRGFVQPADNVMIAGFILGRNSASARIAVRGMGPSLSQFGLAMLLADPILKLHDANGAIVSSNDNWADDPVSAAELISNSLAPQNSLEAGICAALPPGAYTVILEDKNGGTGTGLVEIYNLH